MKVLLFAGGSGKRFWPLGRESLPKQFIRMFNGKSTFEFTVERILNFVKPEDIFVFTNKKYKDLAYEHGKVIPKKNFYFEPYKRDVGPAVGYANIVMESLGLGDEPVVIMWADHIVRNVPAFVELFKTAKELVTTGQTKGVLVGVKPTYPATNLGWIKVKPTSKRDIYEFEGFVYRPKIEEARQLFKTNTGLWNTAYFVSTPTYILSFYKRYYPKLWDKLLKLKESLKNNDTKRFESTYATLEEIHFDYIVYYNLDPKETMVVGADLGWLDVGSFKALKEYYKSDQDANANVVKGFGRLFDSTESMIINKEQGKLTVGVALDDIVIVNTKDVILVIKGSRSKELSNVVKELKQDSELSKYVE